MPRQVVEAVEGQFRREAEIGGYEAKDEAASRIEAVYDSVARLIGSERDEVALLENATRAWEAVFYSLRLRPGDRILTCRAEYGSNFIAYLQAARRHQIEIAVAPDDEHGQLDVTALRDLIDERVKLIGIMHVPTSGGLVNPAAAVGSVARAAGVPFLLDACQSVGQMPVDVQAIGCDFLSATGRKFLRAARHRLPVRAPVVSGPTRALGARGAIGRLDRPRHLSRQGRGAALRDLGNELRGAARPRRRHRLRARPGPRRNLGARSPPGGPPPPRARRTARRRGS
jgi:hypothetical protein